MGEEPPCSQVSPTVCRRRSRSSPHQRGNTPAGSEDPSWLPCPHSQACGSQRPSTRSLAQPSSTANASKRTAAEKYHVRSYGRRKGVEKKKDPFRSASEQHFKRPMRLRGVGRKHGPIWKHS